MFVFGIWNELMPLAIAPPVQFLERNLPNDIQQAAGHRHDAKPARTAIDFKVDRSEYPALNRDICHRARRNIVNVPKTQVSNHRCLRVQPNRSGIHHCFDFSGARCRIRFPYRKFLNIKPI